MWTNLMNKPCEQTVCNSLAYAYPEILWFWSVHLTELKMPLYMILISENWIFFFYSEHGLIHRIFPLDINS